MTKRLVALVVILLFNMPLVGLTDTGVQRYSSSKQQNNRTQSTQPPTSTMPPFQDDVITELPSFAKAAMSTNDDTAHYLLGTTLLVQVFVDTDDERWTNEDRQTAIGKLIAAVDWLENQSPEPSLIGFNVGKYYNVTVTSPITETYGGFDWLDEAAAQITPDDPDNDGVHTDTLVNQLRDQYHFGNTIVLFQPHMRGISYAWRHEQTQTIGSIAVVYFRPPPPSLPWQVNSEYAYAHEALHVFGACDEYVDSGSCNHGIDCGVCDNPWFSQKYNNSNCELQSCPADYECLMRHPDTEHVLCEFTRGAIGWGDADGDGILDPLDNGVDCPQFGGVILYWNSSYNCDNGQGDPGYRQRTTTGFENISGDLNDRASSLKVQAGWSVMLYEGPDRSGASVCLATDIGDFDGSYFDGGVVPLDNNVSSFEVSANGNCGAAAPCSPDSDQIGLYVDANYSGQCMVKYIGEYPNSGAIGLPDNSVTSVIVGDNVKGLLCSDPSYGGACETLTVDDPNLTDSTVGNDTVSSIKVELRGGFSCTPDANQVALFLDDSYQGECVVKDIGEYPNSGAIGLPDNSITSIQVGSNVRGFLCSESNYGGVCETFTGDDPNLTDNTIGNDTVSTVEVELRSGSGPCTPNANQVALFVDNNFGGDCVVKDVGEYPDAGAFGLPDNSITSIQVGNNVQGFLCSDSGFNGICELFTGADIYLGDNTIGNDTISSLKAELRPIPCVPSACQIALFKDDNYHGECIVRDIREYPNGDSLGLPDNSVTSIKVGGYVQGTLCRESNFGGVCETFTVEDPNVTDNPIGNDTVSSVKVEWKPGVPNGNQVALFVGDNYQHLCALKDIGEYPNAAAIGLPDNSITSVIVGDNIRGMLCTEPNYGGICETFTTNDPNVSDNTIGNDTVSSAKVQWRVEVPAPPAPQSPGNGSSQAEGIPRTLAWNPAPDATEYYTEYWGGPLGTVASGWQVGVSWAIGSPWSGYTYSWRVRARNSAGDSRWSDTWTFTVKPAAPSGLAGEAMPCQVNLWWQDNSTSEEGYKIYRDGSYVGQVGMNSRHYEDTGLNGNTFYTYYVAAFRGDIESDPGNIAYVTTQGGVPDAPSLLSPENGSNVYDTTPVIHWATVAGTISYDIQVDNNIEFSSPEIDMTTANSDFEPDTPLASNSYYWRVHSSNACGNSSWSVVWRFDLIGNRVNIYLPIVLKHHSYPSNESANPVREHSGR